MSTVVKDLGGVTAYAAAVSKGYTGTAEEFAELMASYATVAEQAAQSASEAESAKDTAVSAKNDAVSAKNDAVSAKNDAVSAKDTAVSAKDDAISAKNDAVTAKTAAQTAQGLAESASSSASGSASDASGSASSAAGSASSASDSATSAGTNALKSEGFAVGEQNGTPVASGSPYYEKNAKYFAEQAEQAVNRVPVPISGTDDGKLLVADGDGYALSIFLSQLAQIDGYYERMAVGNAEQLISTVFVDNQVPYVFRTAGGSTDIGNRLYDTIIGGSLAWNQLIENGNFTSATGWGKNRVNISVSDNKATLTATATVTDAAYLKKENLDTLIQTDHQYLVTAHITPSKDTLVRMTLFGKNSDNKSILANTKTRITAIMTKGTGTAGLYIYVNRGGSLVEGDTVVVENVTCFDLTQMFGIQIADYIASLETANSGDGIAWFRTYFPKEYYAFNLGEIFSVNVSAHQTVGFNALDPETNKAQLLGGHQYEIVGTYSSVAYVDINGNTETLTISDGLFTPANNGELTVTGADATTCVHLTWSGYRNGEFAEYQLRNYPLDSSKTFRGEARLDDTNSLYFDGDEYSSDGTVKRRYREIVLDGTTTGRKIPGDSQVVTTGSKIYAYIPLDVYGINTANGGGLITNRFVKKVATSEGCVYIGSNGHNLIMTNQDQTLDTADKWNTWLASNNVTVVYELAESTTDDAEPFVSPQIVDDFGTEKYVDNGVQQGTRDVAIPCGHDSQYPPNLRDKLQHIPNTASQNGLYLIQQVNNQMSLVAYIPELPTFPTENGSYKLNLNVANGVGALTWEENV